MRIVSGIFSNVLYKPVLRPVIRVFCGLLAIPLFRFILRHVFRIQRRDAEMERDLEHWFRGSLLLLAATANLEDFLFGWTKWHQVSEPWFVMLLRLLLAVGVIETMPDQDIFGILHRGPPRIRWTPAGLARACRQKLDILRGVCVLHLKRSSPVFAIMTVIFGGTPEERLFTVGWWCYGIAITQYLIIALVTDRDRAAGLLAAFDCESARLNADTLRHAAGYSLSCEAGDDGTGRRFD